MYKNFVNLPSKEYLEPVYSEAEGASVTVDKVKCCTSIKKQMDWIMVYIIAPSQQHFKFFIYLLTNKLIQLGIYKKFELLNKRNKTIDK